MTEILLGTLYVAGTLIALAVAVSVIGVILVACYDSARTILQESERNG